MAEKSWTVQILPWSILYSLCNNFFEPSRNVSSNCVTVHHSWAEYSVKPCLHKLLNFHTVVVAFFHQGKIFNQSWKRDIISDLTNIKKDLVWKDIYHCILFATHRFKEQTGKSLWKISVHWVSQTCMLLSCTKYTRFLVVSRNFTHIFFSFRKIFCLNFVITGLNGSICYCLQFDSVGSCKSWFTQPFSIIFEKWKKIYRVRPNFI